MSNPYIPPAPRRAPGAIQRGLRRAPVEMLANGDTIRTGPDGDILDTPDKSYSIAEIGKAPRGPFDNLFPGGAKGTIASAILNGIRGYTAAQDPSDLSFGPSFGRATVGAAAGAEADEQQAYDRRRQLSADARMEAWRQSEIARNNAAADWYATRGDLANNPLAKAGPAAKMPKWEEEGYPDFATWRADQLKFHEHVGGSGSEAETPIGREDASRKAMIASNTTGMRFAPKVAGPSILDPAVPDPEVIKGLKFSNDSLAAAMGHPEGYVPSGYRTPAPRPAPAGAAPTPGLYGGWSPFAKLNQAPVVPASSSMTPTLTPKAPATDTATAAPQLHPKDIMDVQQGDTAYATWLKKKGYSVP